MSTKFITQNEVYQKLTNEGGGTSNFATKSWIKTNFSGKYDETELNKCPGDNWFVIDDYVVSNCYELTLNIADNNTVEYINMSISNSILNTNPTKLAVVFTGKIYDLNDNTIDISTKTAIIKIPKKYYYSITGITYVTSDGLINNLTLDSDKSGIELNTEYQMTENKSIDIYSKLQTISIITVMNINNTRSESYNVQIDNGSIVNVAKNSTGTIEIPLNTTSFNVYVWTTETPLLNIGQEMYIKRGSGSSVQPTLLQDGTNKSLFNVTNYTAGENITLYIKK